MDDNQTALAGIRVLDLTQVMAGPFCAMQLCDMGADVIKVEPPAGDSTRRMAGAVGTESPAFNAVNRGKRGIVLDLKSPGGQEAVRRLVHRTDIMIENYRPGVMRRLGLDYEALAADHPELIYASISGFGQTGPSAKKGGFDLVAQGVSGLMSITGEPGGAPVKIGVPLTDLGAGLFALSAILLALYHRVQTGRGQYIDTSLVEAGVTCSVWEATEFFTTGVAPQPMGSAHRMSAPYQAFRCADGYITLAAANDGLFARLCDLIGRPEWATRQEFSTDVSRVKHRTTLASLIESVTITRPRSEWIELFETNGLPCGPVNTYDQVFADPHIQARDMVLSTEHPTLGRLTTLGTPIKMSKTRLEPGRRAPLLGEHTRDVLAEIGYTDAEIAQFCGAVG